jgi:T-complex protein 1 subunit epsilon
MIIDEAKRSVHDAICVTRNLIKDNRIVYGGGFIYIYICLVIRYYFFYAEITLGSCEIAISLHLSKIATEFNSYVFNAFCDAIESIPAALADNSGLDPMEVIGRVSFSFFLIYCSSCIYFIY